MNAVSIITISYNNAKGLEKTIRSVVDQTYTDYEYIVVDGGSADGSVDIIKQYTDKITYWVSEPDKGIYNAMNKALLHAEGQYVHFLNSGDIYANSNVLQKFFDGQQRDIALIRGVQVCDYGDRQERWLNIGNRPITLYDMFVNTLLHQATFIRRDLFEKYGTYDESLKIVSDWKFFLKAILGDEQTGFLDEDIVIFEMYGVSTNREHGQTLLKERELVLKELMPANVIADYDRLKSLEEDSYIIRFVKSNKFLFSTFRVWRKLCLTLGIGKK